MGSKVIPGTWGKLSQIDPFAKPVEQSLKGAQWCHYRMVPCGPEHVLNTPRIVSKLTPNGSLVVPARPPDLGFKHTQGERLHLHLRSH